jgi:hypothetical protein
MDPINPLDRLTAILRKRVAENTGLKGKSASAQSEAAQQTAQRDVSPEVLRKRIEVAIEALDPRDPERNKKAARIFVENVLTWQFGDALLSDSRFVALVDEVQGALEQEPGFHESLMAAVRQSGERR